MVVAQIKILVRCRTELILLYWMVKRLMDGLRAIDRTSSWPSLHLTRIFFCRRHSVSDLLDGKAFDTQNCLLKKEKKNRMN
jgi:hypothetical protein